MKNPAKVEQEVLQELEEFAQGNETINKEQLQDWLFKIHPEFDDDLLERKIFLIIISQAFFQFWRRAQILTAMMR